MPDEVKQGTQLWGLAGVYTDDELRDVLVMLQSAGWHVLSSKLFAEAAANDAACAMSPNTDSGTLADVRAEYGWLKKIAGLRENVENALDEAAKSG